MCSKASKQGGRASSLNHSGGLETVWHGSSPAHLSSSQACFIRWAYLAPSSRREASCAKGSLSLRTSTECGGCERRTELLLEGGGIQIYYKGEKTHEKADVKSPCTRQRLETGYQERVITAPRLWRENDERMARDGVHCLHRCPTPQNFEAPIQKIDT